MTHSRILVALFVLSSLLATSASATLQLPYVHDDAGSGVDATQFSPVRVEAGIRYEGRLFHPIDSEDHYVFDVSAGDEVFLTTAGAWHCAHLIDDRGASQGSVCFSGIVLPGPSAIAARDGTWSIRVHYPPSLVHPEPYAFSIGINEPAPPVIPALPENDAGSGHDAPNTEIGAILLEPDTLYFGNMTGEMVFGRADVYAIELRRNDTVRLVTNAVIAFPTVTRPNGQTIEQSEIDPPGYAEFEFTALETGRYHVWWGTPLSKTYDMTYAVHSPPSSSG